MRMSRRYIKPQGSGLSGACGRQPSSFSSRVPEVPAASFAIPFLERLRRDFSLTSSSANLRRCAWLLKGISGPGWDRDGDHRHSGA